MFVRTCGWRMINCASALVMFNAPYFCSGGALLQNVCVRNETSEGSLYAHDSSVELMNPRIGRNVVFVLVEASVLKNDVAAETGMEKSSYSSTFRHQEPDIYRDRGDVPM